MSLNNAEKDRLRELRKRHSRELVNRRNKDELYIETLRFWKHFKYERISSENPFEIRRRHLFSKQYLGYSRIKSEDGWIVEERTYEPSDFGYGLKDISRSTGREWSGKHLTDVPLDAPLLRTLGRMVGVGRRLVLG